VSLRTFTGSARPCPAGPPAATPARLTPRATALYFLRTTPVLNKNVYVIVEAPEGNASRDVIGVAEW